MTIDLSTYWPSDDEYDAIGEGFRTFVLDLEDQFPGRGSGLAIIAVLLSAAMKFISFKDQEDVLAATMNIFFQEAGIPWRVERCCD